MDAAQAKRNRLPFKPPRRQSAGTSNSTSTTSKTTSKTTSRKTSSTSKPPTSKSTSKGKTTTQKPSSSKTKATSTTTSNSRKRKAQSISSDSEDSNEADSANDNDNKNDNDSRSRSNSPFQEPDYILAEIITNDRPRNIESDEPGIPPKLLTTILHHRFQNSKTKITKDANEVVAKYMDIFVREALARAAYERAEATNGGGGGGRPGADGFLEVEDLEKLAPQMLLDF